jgi:serine/threonine protein kinase
MELQGYSNLAVLSEGGMSTVYKASQDSPERTVAIKFLSAGYVLDDQDNALFLREAEVIARLEHRNIVRVLDHGLSGDRPYFVMEYIPGRRLNELQHDQGLSPAAGLHMMLQICRGLSYAHRNGIIHRDLNPDNILVTDRGHVYILDFGIAWLEEHGRSDADTVVGKADYLSPEQFQDPAHIGPASDIYALGVLMFEHFTRHKPEQDEGERARALEGLPRELAELINHCLAANPSRRPRSAQQVALRLLRMLKGEHIHASEKAEAMVAIGSLASSFELLDVISHNQYGSVYLYGEKDGEHMMVAKKRMGTHAGLRQAQQLKAIGYKNIVRIIGVSAKRETFVVLMEYLAGGSVRERLARAWSPERFVPVALEICYAMQRAHDEGMVHGNLRPSNVLLDESGQVRVSDFGYSKHYSGNQQRDWYQPQSRLDASVQRDIYSAGIIFHHMLTGVLPQVSFGLLVHERAFEALDGAFQQLLRNMIEMQSANRVSSFREVIDVLNDLRLGVRPRFAARRTAEKHWKRLSYLLLLAGAALSAGFAYLLMA